MSIFVKVNAVETSGDVLSSDQMASSKKYMINLDQIEHIVGGSVTVYSVSDRNNEKAVKGTVIMTRAGSAARVSRHNNQFYFFTRESYPSIVKRIEAALQKGQRVCDLGSDAGEGDGSD